MWIREVKTRPVLAWHFSDGMRCRYDGRPIVVGETLTVDGPIELCSRGLHASAKILDALVYAPGCTISRVRLSGTVLAGDDKLVASERHTIWSVDIRQALVYWAAECAERTNQSDTRSVAAIAAAKAWALDPTEANRNAAYAANAAAYNAANAAERQWQSRRLRRLIGQVRRGEKLQ